MRKVTNEERKSEEKKKSGADQHQDHSFGRGGWSGVFGNQGSHTTPCGRQIPLSGGRDGCAGCTGCGNGSYQRWWDC